MCADAGYIDSLADFDAGFFNIFMNGKDDSDVADICYTSNVGRTHHSWRVSAPVTTAADLTRFVERQQHRVERLRSTTGRKNVALMFSGGGTQYPGMGLSLLGV
ncbi:hypothetical protein H180DRAFT_00494 [Streptomyces sp. WMMB 322]|nr:hypothetical protein H180DRAFT_00494 [Streptomyces sp. WMMB 322]